MSMVMNLVMLGCTYPILFLLYFFMKLEIGDKKTTVLGIAIPGEFRKDPQVLEICGKFRRDIKFGMIAMLLFPVLFFWMPWFTWYITGYIVWIYLMIAVEMIPMARYGEQLKELKRRMGWGSSRISETDVDFSLALQPVHVVKKWILAVLCILSLLPALWELAGLREGSLEWENLLILFLMASLVWCFCVMMLWMDRQKSELISKDSEVNRKFNRSKKRMRAAAWTWAAGLSVVLVWLSAFALHERMGGMIGFTAAVSVYTVAVCWLAIRCEWRILGLRRKLMTSLDSYDGDEAYWYFGALLYYNPNDRHFLVENRVGTGYSVNVGSVGGKVMMGLTVLLLAGLLVWVPVTVGREEFTPIGLEVQNGTLRSTHIGTEYEIDQSEIASVTLLEDLPEVSRKNGTGLPNLSKGRYKIDGYGTGYLCLNPQNSEFLLIETDDGTVYLFSDDTDEGTLEVYRELSVTIQPAER